MTSRQKVVAITGSSGQIGAKLLEHLEDTPGLGKLVAFDTRPMREPVHNIASFRKDVTTGIHEELLRMGATTVVHLAFRWKSGLRRREAATLSERNEKALRSVLDSCRRARVRHIIYLSSHTVYGARPDNPLPLHEDSPLRPSEGFPYAQDNYLAEKLLQEFAEEEPDIKLTIFRSCPALGAMSDTEILKEFYFPGWVGSSGHNPPLQFVYEDDLARVMCRAIMEEHTGVFNVAGNGVCFLRELSQSVQSRRAILPATVAHPLKRVTGGAFVAYSHYLDRWPIIMGTGKLTRITGYRFRHTASQAVAALASYNKDIQDSHLRWSESRERLT